MSRTRSPEPSLDTKTRASPARRKLFFDDEEPAPVKAPSPAPAKAPAPIKAKVYPRKPRASPVRPEAAKVLEESYYGEKYLYGRDGLFHIVQQRKDLKVKPTEGEIRDWLAKQKLNQLYKGTRRGGTDAFFVPTFPWHHISIDLIDFKGKPAFLQESKPDVPKGVYKYILSVLDNYSRMLYTQPMKNKEAVTTAQSLEKVLNRIKKDYPKGVIAKPELNKYGRCLMDDGSEFKGKGEMTVTKVLAKHQIKVHRILGGHPEQNALVERSNKGIKMIMAKMNKMNELGWIYNYQQATDRYNEHFHRGISMPGAQLSPGVASKHTEKDQFEELKNAVVKSYRPEPKGKEPSKFAAKEFKVGDKVRIKLNKSILDKSSDVSWSSKVYEVKEVKPQRLTTAKRYIIKFNNPAKEKYEYTKNDLQKIEEVEEIPSQYMKKVPEARRTTRQLAGKLELSKGQFTEDKEKQEQRTLRERKKKEEEPKPDVEISSVLLRKQPKRKGAKKPVASVERIYAVERIVQRRKKTAKPNKGKYEVLIKWKNYPSSQNTWELEAAMIADVGEQVYKEMLDEYKV
jgi:ribosomal protein L21E